ncbi:MAG: hypothetical protein HQ567_12020 [Candidatus Nealsonbacteria bacterium]|nr:hypothetical protein [Candidatus Nealsonbacteria bacterium]
MEPTDNPYQSPESSRGPQAGPLPGMAYQRRPRGLVGHVRVVAILMIVQGVLETLMGVGLIVAAVVVPQIIAQQQRGEPQWPPQGLPPEEVLWMVRLMYGGMGLAGLIAGVLHIVAGVRNYRFRGRTFGIVASVAGLLAIATCYCLPTAVAVAVYGLVVLLNTEVSEAFALREAGYPSSDVLAHFG